MSGFLQPESDNAVPFLEPDVQTNDETMDSGTNAGGFLEPETDVRQTADDPKEEEEDQEEEVTAKEEEEEDQEKEAKEGGRRRSRRRTLRSRVVMWRIPGSSWTPRPLEEWTVHRTDLGKISGWSHSQFYFKKEDFYMSPELLELGPNSVSSVTLELLELGPNSVSSVTELSGLVVTWFRYRGTTEPLSSAAW